MRCYANCRRLSIAFLGALLLPAVSSAQQFGYSFTDLGIISNAPRSYSALINNSGRIVLNVAFRPNVTLPFVRVYDNGVPHSLPGLGSGSAASVVTGLNENGQMVGLARDGGFGPPPGFPTVSPALWDGSLVSPLTDFGLVGGSVEEPANPPHSQITNSGHILFNQQFYNGSSVIDLGFVGTALNDNDKVIGPAADGFKMWSSGTGVQTIPAFVTGLATNARDINNTGLVVGDAIVAGGAAHAFSYDGAYHDLNSLVGGATSKALFVNNNGAIVGDSDRGPWLYDAGQMYLLRNYLPGAWSSFGGIDASIGETARDFKGVLGINDQGQIILGGFDFGHFNELLYSFTPRADPGVRAFAITAQDRSMTTFASTAHAANFLGWHVDVGIASQQSKISDQRIEAAGFAAGIGGPASSVFDMTFTLTKPGAVFLKSFGDVHLLHDGTVLGGTEGGSTTFTETSFVLPAGSYQIKGVADVTEVVSENFSLVLTVPEPSTFALALIGAVLSLAIIRKRATSLLS